MTVTIELPPDVESRLASRAASHGQDVASYIRHLVRQDLEVKSPVAQSNDATIKLLAQWDEEDATDDPAEIERRKREWEELKRALNQNREEVGARKLFP